MMRMGRTMMIITIVVASGGPRAGAGADGDGTTWQVFSLFAKISSWEGFGSVVVVGE